MVTLPPELFAAVLDAAPDAVLVVDAQSTIVFASQAVATVFGHVPSTLLGQPIEVLVPVASRERHRGYRDVHAADTSPRPMGARLDIVGQRADGTEVPLDISLSPIRTDAGRFTICIARDVTERRALEQKLRQLSYRDSLTGLYSRAYFDAELARLDGSRLLPVTIFVFDVDYLKRVNDGEGHMAGDQLLCRAAEVLRRCFRSEDVVARVGGDEFATLLPKVGAEEAEALANRLGELLAQGASGVSLSYGYATATEPPLVDALREADRRMYEQKRAARR